MYCIQSVYYMQDVHAVLIPNHVAERPQTYRRGLVEFDAVNTPIGLERLSHASGRAAY